MRFVICYWCVPFSVRPILMNSIGHFLGSILIVCRLNSTIWFVSSSITWEKFVSNQSNDWHGHCVSCICKLVTHSLYSHKKIAMNESHSLWITTKNGLFPIYVLYCRKIPFNISFENRNISSITWVECPNFSHMIRTILFPNIFQLKISQIFGVQNDQKQAKFFNAISVWVALKLASISALPHYFTLRACITQ